MQRISWLVHPRKATAHRTPRWVSACLLFLLLAPPSRGQQAADAKPVTVKSQFLIPLCMIAGTHARDMVTGSQETKNQILRKFGVDSVDWSVFSNTCQALFAGIGALAKEARAAESQAKVQTLDSVSIAAYNRRRRAMLLQSLANLQRNLSAPGWSALSGWIKELEANTTGARIP